MVYFPEIENIRKFSDFFCEIALHVLHNHCIATSWTILAIFQKVFHRELDIIVFAAQCILCLVKALQPTFKLDYMTSQIMLRKFMWTWSIDGLNAIMELFIPETFFFKSRDSYENSQATPKSYVSELKYIYTYEMYSHRPYWKRNNKKRNKTFA